MARYYIPINSVNDIDTSKITLATINNRYIDKSGNRYATRFNKRTRKIEIVRIALGREEALQARAQFLGKKIQHQEGESSEPKTTHPAPWKLPSWIAEYNIQPNENVDIREYLMGLERETEKISERIRGLISNIKNSTALDGRKEGNHDAVLELTTFYDREVMDHLNKTQSRIMELQRFPKPVLHYLATLEKRQKAFVEKLNVDKQKEYFKAYFISQSLLNALHGCFQLVAMVERFLVGVNPEKLPYDKRQYLENAKATIDFLKRYLREETAKVLGWLKRAEVI
ncbi:MAG: hypothetical protein NZM25_01460 [Leptospiraceae bacterium]|nr:hypothetical protein [Leptospiraceae bacterium]MDW8306393.1 hypothetical protein [Leptospiraceae bacterium]